MADPTIDFAAFYDEYFAEIYNYFFLRFLNKETAEDLTSKTFLKIVEHLNQFDPAKAQPRTWLWRIAQNTLIDYFRTNKISLSLDDENFLAQGCPSVSFEEQYNQLLSPRRKLMYEALCQLSQRERVLIYHKYYLERSYHEIAEEFKLNESTLATVLSRAKQKMRAFVREQDDSY